ncbi:MAG: bile acid:sodium symporter family protein [Algoriphagus sp.]|uniref:bile acid:sodium symporter family protein n=1 Tax=Algoriphagus sp. TaxID=1872435 RepID=UPI00272FC573|nr:bile acid:sodium symporter family protein [Algoriphagus sp.]MDP2042077.1 bile acid:sodium symporter family protein [Algoriphagus sp.]MDP3201286.1 bile acid:sodium symporter family protein [Algoriphagus sp.]MDP3473084.1 bile acid:sodium symporter family protein [Algoriphagus sp.]
MSSTNPLDSIRLNFSQGDLLLLNLALALIMYGVALDLRWEDFRYLLKNPKGFFMGIFSQFLLLPFLTWVLISIIKPPPSVALGMFLVAACPGGNVSNFLTSLAKGNTALSVSLTGFSSILSIFSTPLNFALWAGFYEPTSLLLREISLNISDVFFTVGIILGLPLILGIFTHKRFPKFADKAAKILKPLSILIFAAFVGLAFAGNFNIFIQYIGMIFVWVLAHNFIALSAGFLTGKLGGLPIADIKTLTIETGIQNSGLGLVLIFTYFEGLGGMAIITALWGIWHLISGMTIASLWKLRE